MSLDKDVECFCCGDAGCVCQSVGKDSFSFLKEFQDRFNPAHYYCRLRELGIGKSDALAIVKVYDEEVYKVAMAIYKKNTK